MMDSYQRHSGPYTLQHQIMNAASYEMWHAVDTRNQQPVLLTLCHFLSGTNNQIPRFLEEARDLGRLDHPGIAKLIAVQLLTPTNGERSDSEGAEQAVGCMAFEDVIGVTLEKYLAATVYQGQFIAFSILYQIIAPICSALDYAHQHGVIHGCLRPAFCVYPLPGEDDLAFDQLSLIGFGLHSWQSTARLSLVDAFYTAPEVVRGQAVNIRSDLYSLGVMLYELCTGARPFDGATPEEVLQQHIETVPMSPSLINPHIVPGLIPIIFRCLAKEPGERFATGGSLLASLHTLRQRSGGLPSSLKHSGGYATSPSWPQPVGKSDDATVILHQSTPQHMLTPPTELRNNTHVPASLDTPTLFSSPSLPSLRTGEQEQVERRGSSTPSQPSHAIPPAVSGLHGLPGRSIFRQPPHVSRKLLLIGLPVLACLLIFSALIGSFLSTARRPASAVELYGHALFANSGALNPNSTEGVLDELTINMNNLPQPAVGKVYYGWLLADNDTNSVQHPPINLGALSLKGGQASNVFTGLSSHENLLANYSRFLITEEDAATVPDNPSLNANAMRFSATFSQVRNPVTHYSLLDHLRHLLVKDPKLEALNIHGGLDINLFRNMLKVLEWSGSARDAQLAGNDAFAQRQVKRVLAYLDGAKVVQTEQIPASTDPPATLVDHTLGQVGLLSFNGAQVDGYLKHIGFHLREIANSQGVTTGQRGLAAEVNVATNNATHWLDIVHSDAVKLLNMSDTQMHSHEALAVLNDMFQNANYALVGQINPTTNQLQEGIAQIHYNIQRLATFDVTACTISSCF